MRTKARPTRRGPQTVTIVGTAAIAASASPSASFGEMPGVHAATSSTPSRPHAEWRTNAATVTPSKSDGGSASRLRKRNTGGADDDDDDVIFDQSNCSSVPASRRILYDEDDDSASDVRRNASAKRRRILFEDKDEEDKDEEDGQFSIDVGEDTTLISVPPSTRKIAPTPDAYELIQFRLSNTKLVADGVASPSITMDAIDAVEAVITQCNQSSDSDASLDIAPIMSAFGDGMLELVLKQSSDQSQVTVSLRLLMASCVDKLSAAQLRKATPPIPTPRRLPGSAKLAKPHPSYTLLQMLGSVFRGSIFADVADSLANPLRKEGQRNEFITAKMVYSVVDNVHRDEFHEQSESYRSPLEIPGLVPTLRPYQDAAVRWMLKREGKSDNNNADTGSGVSNNEWELCWYVVVEYPEVAGTKDDSITRSHVMPLSKWRDGKHSPDERQIFCNPFSGWLASSYIEAKCMMLGEGGDLKGGILAESMGLGKTVEVIACILANPSPLSLHPQAQTPTEETEISTFADTESQSPHPMTKKAVRVTKPSSLQDVACICGRSASYKDCLSWVVCEECNGAMHGHCAGFDSEEELLSETKEGSGSGASICKRDHCPSCVAVSMNSTAVIESRATLIVTPPAILTQWQREISRHTNLSTGKPLKVVVYPGVRDLCRTDISSPHEDFGLVHPHKLADADVVMVTFQGLMSDLGHSDDNPFAGFGTQKSSRLRSRRRYRVVPSPLMSIKWWRVCLDEAQRVEAPTAASARMARKLITERRWCVSGTPIGRGRLDDLYGLLLFLTFKPFDEKRWFSGSFMLYHGDALKRLSHLLKRVLWRSTKANRLVHEQMGIPEQEEKKVVLQFSSVERYFYNRQYEKTSAAAKRWTIAKSYESLSHSLQKLRAACCHPQVGVSGIGGHVLRGQQGVLSMDQILEKLIEDSKLKCEDAQRIATLHTIGLASLTKLKAHSDEDMDLLKKSLELYQEALDLADTNASPTEAIGTLTLSGSEGFRKDQLSTNNGAATLDWQMRPTFDKNFESLSVWCNIDYHQAKAISTIKVRSCLSLPPELREHVGSWTILRPKQCILQMSSATLGGSFVDVHSFTLSEDMDVSGKWKSISTGYRAQKSKAWRIAIRSFYSCGFSLVPDLETCRYYTGLDVKLFEPEIAFDDLQRLHILHNASIGLSGLLQARYSDANNDATTAAKLGEMETEARAIHETYLAHAQAVHSQSKDQLLESIKAQKKCDGELEKMAYGSDRAWYEDTLAWFHLNGDYQDQQRLCEAVHHDLCNYYENQGDKSGVAELAKTLDGSGGSWPVLIRRGKFPLCNSVDGLLAALAMRVGQSRDEFKLREGNNQDECVRAILNLSSMPTVGEVYANSHCQNCREDWNQTGPVCSHCLLEGDLVKLQKLSNDPEMHCVFKAIAKFVSNHNSRAGRQRNKYLETIQQRSKKFFEVQRKVREELRAAKQLWVAHFNLLSDIDELNQCKCTMRLQQDAEDVSALTETKAAFIVDQNNIAAELMEHEVKQASALGDLKRNKHSLRYLKNQRLEKMTKTAAQSGGKERSPSASTREVCSVCLSPFDGEECSVLPCGHSFHPSCVDLLFKRTGGANAIRCPMRCPVVVKRGDIFLASEKSKDDGSRAPRAVKGDWGCKVNRLIGDVLDIHKIGEKGVIFSQWSEMLSIVEEALRENHVRYVHPRSGKRFGEDIKRFRSSDIPVLLINVKNGAEGLTLTEATHVFMVEPILNCGLDMQAVNRIHRIGQDSKTFVHRYIVANTIEEKIDAIRMERQEKHFEDDLQEQKKHSIKGGGIDGGFDLSELQELFGWK